MFDLGQLADSNNKYVTVALNLTSGAALLCAAAWFSYNMFSARDAELPIRIINKTVVDPTILLAGKPFTTRINVTLNRLCPYEAHWSLVRRADGVEVVKVVEPITLPPAQTGTQDLPPLSRYIPASVQPGEYRYVAEVFDLCPGNRALTAVRSNVDITIR